MMANKAAVAEGEGPEAADPQSGTGKIVIATRFGEIEFDKAQAIFMPRGLPGFPGARSFALTQLPHPGMQQFSLLQCLEDADLSFMILPLDVDSGIIDREDLEQAREALGIAAADMAVVLIVTIREQHGKPQISVNLRAPIFLDAQNRTGAQHVLGNSKYSVRHDLSAAPDADGAE